MPTRTRKSTVAMPLVRSRSLPALILLVMVVLVWAATSTTRTAHAAASVKEKSNLLMIGNSYVSFHNLIGMLESMLEESGAYDTERSVFYEQAVGSATLRMHYLAAMQEGSQFGQVLRKRKIPWNYIVLQEQSLTGASVTSQNLAEVVELHNVLVEAVAAASPVPTDNISNNSSSSSIRPVKIIFMMTWGRRDGVRDNSDMFPDFLTMNARLEQGYRAYVNATTSNSANHHFNPQQHQTILAPVGLAFQYIYEQDQRGRGKPNPGKDPSTDFYRLYDPAVNDGSHPSVHGSYLAACVLYGVLTGGFDPRALTYAPPGVHARDRDRWQQAAAVVTATEQGGVLPERPWPRDYHHDGDESRLWSPVFFLYTILLVAWTVRRCQKQPKLMTS